jgi:aerobic C4-dicarboxylate transport protein
MSSQSSQSSQQIFKAFNGSDETRKPLYRHLYFQVISAIIFGILLGYFYPSLGEQMKPLGDLFIKLVKLLIAPIIFCTVVHGIASMNDIKKVGRVGIRALIYFEIMTTIALVIGLVAMNLVRPGAGLNVDPNTLNASAVASYASQAKSLTFVDYIMHIVPNTFFGAFAEGDILQTLFVALLFAFGLHALGNYGRPVVELVERSTQVFFGMMRIIMYVSPVGAFGAMAFTIGKYGIGSLFALAHLLITFYIVCAIFVFGVLGFAARLAGFSLWKFLRYIREELLLVLGTASSETALPRLIAKLEALGCEESVVGLVVPAGWTFNLDGTCISLTTMAIFVAQATNTELSLYQELAMLGVMLLTSKGAAGVTGGAFIALAATLSSFNTIPVASLALLLGVYRFISEAVALVNLIGNGVATIVVAKWDGALDEAELHLQLDSQTGIAAGASAGRPA